MLVYYPVRSPKELPRADNHLALKLDSQPLTSTVLPSGAGRDTHQQQKEKLTAVSCVDSERAEMSNEAEGFICPYCLVGFATSSKLQGHFVEMHSGQSALDEVDYSNGEEEVPY